MRNEETNMLALVKGEERYVFLYTDAQAAEVLQTIGRFASNPDLSFTWYDAAVVATKVRKQLEEQRAKKCADEMSMGKALDEAEAELKKRLGGGK